jgi:wobble nucleotide-excising tRNase
MIDRIQLIRNVGQFDSVSSGAALGLARLTLVYAENGRGKTTLAAVLRSLATGDPILIAERRRLQASHPPHVVLVCAGGPPDAMFQNGSWNRTLSDLVIFDDLFIDQNVHSGLAVAAGHRQKLHELILGAGAVSLNQQLQQRIDRIEIHNATLRQAADAIPASERAGLPVDDFCALPQRADIDAAIEATEQNLAAANQQDLIRNFSAFDGIRLPGFPVSDIEGILDQSIQSLDVTALQQVQRRLAELGRDGERWVAQGMIGLSPEGRAMDAESCPLCAQDLSASPIIGLYRAYFSAEYANLKQRVEGLRSMLGGESLGMNQAAFERAIRVAVERRQFWSQFTSIPEIAVDTAMIVRDWQAAHQVLADAASRKASAPLEHVQIGDEARAGLAQYESHRGAIRLLSDSLQSANSNIQLVKERAATSDAATIAADLTQLKAVRARHSPSIESLCAVYLAEKAAKTVTEQERDQIRGSLNTHRTSVFSSYQTAMNVYLQRFYAGFRLDSVTFSNTRGGPTCTYNVLINNTPVNVSSEPTPGEPSFRTVLSSGDRNTLALGFFFASLDQDNAIGQKTVVIDDPISSLDDHRALTTIQEIRRIADRAGQVIVLSHNKSFLCRIWEGSDQSLRTAVQISRDGTGSTIQPWDVDRDCITEHDRRHEMLREYLSSGGPNARDVAVAIRPVLEAYFRVTCPRYFPPGTLLGPFLNTCTERIGPADQILDTQQVQELGDLIEYANKFHHDTNAACETEQINDLELNGFVHRTLDFARP